MISLATKRESALRTDLRGIEVESSSGPRSRLELGAHRNIEQSIAYMVQHTDEALQVSKLAAVANFSPSHFFAVFKQATGFAPMDFFIRLRMQRACELLDETIMCIKEVADELGYDDPFYFSRVFKSVNGMSPTDYRRLELSHRLKIKDGALPVQNGCAAALRACQIELGARAQNFGNHS